jgi:transcriptional regulator with XRE-family HTH domain
MSADTRGGGRFGRLLREYRMAAGLTQEDLADRAGLSGRALSDMERGRTARPFARSVRLLADALELPADRRDRGGGQDRAGAALGAPGRGPVR